MHIREIEIDNFKSFAIKTVIPFEQGFTTISGPNGSGKSNVIDSILFALGFSTSRTLRAEKLTDLINNSSRKREASVRILFSNGKEDLEIKRRVKEGLSGYGSTFYINGTSSTLTEVHDLLSMHNISPGCYNVVMQGDVTGIINMSNYERRKIIDEIAGVSDFDRRIDQANQELKTVEDRIEKSNIILGEIHYRQQQLESEKDKALQYQDLKNQKADYQSKINLVHYKETKQKLHALEENIKEAFQSIDSTQQHINTLKNQLSDEEKIYEDVSAQIKIKGEDEQLAIRAQIEALKGAISRNTDSIQFSETKIKEQNDSIITGEKEISRITAKLDDIDIRYENKQEQLKHIEKQLLDYQKELEQSLKLTKTLDHSLTEDLDKRKELKSQLEHKEDEKGFITREKLRVEDSLKRIKTDMQDAESVIHNCQTTIETLTQDHNTIKSLSEDLADQVLGADLHIKRVRETTLKKKSELDKLDHEIAIKYRKYVQLEANHKAIEEVSFGKAIEVVLQSGLPGIYGTISQLYEVDDDYALALEIALGGKIKNIVVDDDRIAAQAIELLKRSNAGRVTLLPLNKIKSHFNYPLLPKDKGIIDYAVELISYNDEFDRIFEYALGETVIVQDLALARSLIGKYRTVTLDGSLTEKTGAMTGGSTPHRNKRSGSDTEKELRYIKQEMETLQNTREEILKTIKNLEKDLSQAEEEHRKSVALQQTKKLEQQNMSTKLQELKDTLQSREKFFNALELSYQENTRELNSIHQKLESFNHTIENLKKEIGIIESRLPTDNIEKLNDAVGNLEFTLKNLESKRNNIENELKSIMLERDFNTNSIDFQKEKIQKAGELVIEFHKKMETEKRENTITQAKIEELSEKIKSLGSELMGLQEKRSEQEKKIRKLEGQLNNVTSKIDKIQEQIAAYELRKQELNTALTSIRHELREAGISLQEAEKLHTTVHEIETALKQIAHKMENLEPVNMLAITEYEEISTRKNELEEKLNTLSTEKEELTTRINSYSHMKFQSFRLTFESVNGHFQDIFKDLSDGEGSLVLENNLDPFSGGLIILARPRNKKQQRLESMSGGEKSLTALAFVFAIQRYMPAPFYAFDEVDMFLDGINAEKLSKMVLNQAQLTQFIVVSLRKPMLESSNRTIGVTQRNDGISKVTGIALNV